MPPRTFSMTFDSWYRCMLISDGRELFSLTDRQNRLRTGQRRKLRICPIYRGEMGRNVKDDDDDPPLYTDHSLRHSVWIVGWIEDD